MVPRHTDVCDPDLTLMSSSDLDAIIGNVLDNHHVIGFLGNALKHYVLPCRFLDRHQLVLIAVLFDESGVLVLADLAVKLLEIVLDGAPNDFLLHFRLVPFLEAVEVHQTACATALAWLAQEFSFLCALSKHTVFAF